MQTLTVDVFVSVDGWAKGIDSPGYFGYFGPELAEWISTELARPQVIVFGRRTYEALAGIPEEARDESWRRALALFDLAAASGDERFRSTAMAAMAFEREAFWSELERWLRDPEREAGGEPAGDAEKSLAMTWCYGAPGVGLARRGALRSVDDANLRDELARATEITLERGFGKNHCICHGDLGNLDLLQEVQRMNGDPALGEAVARLSRAILASIERDGWRCGTVGGIESPGLMNGLAGIGYGLLRLADPAHVPSVLLMEPPRA